MIALADSATGAPPLWTVAPFALYLLVIAVAPLFFGHFWEKNRNKLIIAVAASLPVAGYLLFGHAQGPHWLWESLQEYVVFIVLLAALFVISGGVYLKGALAGTPIVNTGILGLGALLASFIGTTGASMLLIRPLLRANESRLKKVHLVVFFIFTVSNGGGMLTPLGDPPLFLGFIRGVDFLWTFRLVGPWAVVNAALLATFWVLDQVVLNKEERGRPGSQLEEVQKVKEPLGIQGGLNFLWLLGVLAVNLGVGYAGREYGWGDGLQKLLLIGGMGGMALLSLRTTAREVRAANKFTWGPIIEVAVIFIGIFVTMVPALKVLMAKGTDGSLKISEAWQFFWMSGVLSSFLDNAPTYLTFASLATGVVNGLHPGANLSDANLGGLLRYPEGVAFLTAISCGSVFMGANTYIGNGPNFMVKAIAEEGGVRMPSFFGYMLWSVGVLVPLFIGVTLIFFR